MVSNLKHPLIYFSLTLCFLFLNCFDVLSQFRKHCHYQNAVPVADGKCINGDWTLVFHDEFNGNKLNKSKWYPYFGYGNRCHGSEPQAYIQENVSVNNGTLSLKMKNDPDNYKMCNGGQKFKPYSSGMIYSKETFKYGAFEAKIKIPNGNNFWPAFWTWGPKGEIDVFEFYDKETKPHFSVHDYDPKHKRCTYNEDLGTDFSSKYFTYTAVWDRFYVAFFINGDLKGVHWLYYTIQGKSGITCDNIKANHSYIASLSFPTDHPQHIIINHAIQNEGSPSPLPSEVKVKYVRAWQKGTNVCKNRVITNLSGSNNHIKGKKVTLKGIRLNAGEKLKITASKDIEIKNNVYIDDNAEFKTNIKPLLCSSPKLSKRAQPKPNIDLSQLDSLGRIENNRQRVFKKQNDQKEERDKSKKKIEVFPKPAGKKIKVLSEEKGYLTILNLSGKVLLETPLNKGLTKIETESFSQGMYLLKITLDDQVFRKKMMIKK